MKKTMTVLMTMIFMLLSFSAMSQTRLNKGFPGDSRNAICPEGQIWSLQLQCDVGTRSGIERIWPGGNSSMPGVEACVVTYQGCQPIEFATNGPRGREATASGQPLTIVIFGVRRIIDVPGL